jgi:hypothetical protein
LGAISNVFKEKQQDKVDGGQKRGAPVPMTEFAAQSLLYR